ncbi:MAG: serine/threonine protein kinase [Muribaculaceae bacterium]|nr:serine/threonine protein kinase [Muribaculaceae bacterium]
MKLKENTELQSGKYRIIRVLGQGGFGITYLAENVFFNKIVAIKEFFPKSFCGRDNTSHLTLGTANNAETVEKLLNRFMKEAKNIANLDHPGIVKIQDIFKENNTAYYVMDYIEGDNLNEIVKRNGPLSEKKAVEYIQKVGEALDYIHSKNMTHFDVKPANIMIRRSDDMPILIDFGLSKQYDASGDATSTMLNGVSQGYSPIELYNPGSLDTFSPHTDIYSLGATLYYLLSGKVPPNASEIAIDGVPNIPGASNEVQSIVKTAMAVRPGNRHQSISKFVQQLNTEADEDTVLLPGGGTTPPPPPKPPVASGASRSSSNSPYQSNPATRREIKHKKNNTWIWIIVALVVVFAIIEIIILSVGHSSKAVANDSDTVAVEVVEVEEVPVEELPAAADSVAVWVEEEPTLSSSCTRRRMDNDYTGYMLIPDFLTNSSVDEDGWMTYSADNGAFILSCITPYDGTPHEVVSQLTNDFNITYSTQNNNWAVNSGTYQDKIYYAKVVKSGELFYCAIFFVPKGDKPNARLYNDLVEKIFDNSVFPIL